MTNSEPNFLIDVDQRAHITLLRLSGELDLLSAPQVTKKCSELAEEGCTSVVVDATGLTFLDSSGVSALIEGRSTIHEQGSDFSVVPSDAVRRLFDLLDLHQLFPTHESIDEALNHLGVGTAATGGSSS